jgi:hypothetical protein
MDSAQRILSNPRRRGAAVVAIAETLVSSRIAIYFAATTAAVIGNFLLGKEMMGDTLNYHLYAGFSALHDRFGQDYFAAGPQSYFNPYVYVPFYLLARSGLSALAASSILAVAQSAIFWLTYEIAMELAPQERLRIRSAMGLSAVVLAFANPILIGQLGSSYADVITAELVLGGWLLLLRATRLPDRRAVLAAGLLLGASSALKLTNCGHALCAFVLLGFMPGGWRVKARCFAMYAAAVVTGFLIIAGPWGLHLERQFGNPLFPLLNEVFKSPQYPTTGLLDYRFIPDSLTAALYRPFALLSPRSLVDDEFPSPDSRYALLSILAVLMMLRWVWVQSRRHRSSFASPAARDGSMRALAAVGCAFLADWILWLRMSGNGRYFIAMACIAAAIAMSLLFRLLAAYPKVRNYALAAVFCLQFTQLSMGAVFRSPVRWDDGPWFEVSVPRKLAVAPMLYLTFGDASNAFVAAFLPRGSGLINIGGTYELGPGGANGARVEDLIHQYAPHLQVLVRDPRVGAAGRTGPPDLRYANDALEPFALRADPESCTRISVQDVVPGMGEAAASSRSSGPAPAPDTGYLVACPAVPDRSDRSALLASERAADVVFNRIEDACPELFQPSRQISRNYSGSQAYVWVRQYSGVGLDIFIGPGGVEVSDVVRGGFPEYLGRESDWLNSSPRLACGRVGQHYYARMLPRSL